MEGLPTLPDELGSVTDIAPLGGGDVARAWQARLAGGRTVVVKQTPYDASFEAEGLRALAAAGAPVPTVLAVETHLLVMDHVTGPPDWEALGAALAGVHTHHASRFGWHRDNVIGPLPQANGWSATWGAFVVERRIAPHLDALPVEVAKRLTAAGDGPLPELLDEHAPPASLVHGDLWTGNVVGGRWLIDPAVHYADRETDLAMLTLFGGPPGAFWHGYLDAAPLPDGWERRRPVLQLAPLLVHVRLFGHGYVPAVIRALDAAGFD